MSQLILENGHVLTDIAIDGETVCTTWDATPNSHPQDPDIFSNPNNLYFPPLLEIATLHLNVWPLFPWMSTLWRRM